MAERRFPLNGTFLGPALLTLELNGFGQSGIDGGGGGGGGGRGCVREEY